MLQAGLTDPSRPIGVFLFAGPTGTGKTEVVKALAEYLFGSSDRMLRIDMSELQHWGAHTRIVGQSDERGGSESLASRVRAEPFQVILLDEFEKAHASVWDLFLQVFDDARLTDANGRLADFRHCLIILTTNLGAVDHQGGGPGFTSGGASFADAQVLRAVGSAFRPEFVNRLDRIVVFRPLTRAAMREVLRKELDRVLFRPGFRERQWAVEWESSAIEFLLDVGFTPDMGARPLRRAVEQHVLAPLALTIAERRYPEGDQFLFVSSDGTRIDVAFIDPDGEPEPGSRPERGVSRGAASNDLRALILDSRGHQDATAFLSRYAASMEALTTNDAWAARKGELIARMGEAGFWRAENRFEVLDALERIDRLDAMRASIDSLLTRIGSHRDRQGMGERELVGRVALNLYLLEAAWTDMKEDRPGEVLIAIRLPLAEGDPELGAKWLGTLATMYNAWATRRLARHQSIEDTEDPAKRLILISGAGVCGLLSPESGRHVLERTDKKTGKLRRVIACVDVMPLATPFPAKPRARRSLIAKLLDQCPEPEQAPLVRRYQDGRTKLVRDAARGWRTGRLETVLGGDFDLISA
ncbi:MAG: AAA family ATPase [Burkholderiaceae bacterium]